MAKIWVSDAWYIPVDDSGYVTGPCFEGMLGCVLQPRTDPDQTVGVKTGSVRRAALKIPRLMADTIEENAYICKMMIGEEEAVMKIDNAGGRVHDLVAAQFFGSNPLLKRRATEESSFPEARRQHRHVIFVSFERDRKPRFCSVNLTDKGFSIFPPGCKDDFEKGVAAIDWPRLAQLTEDVEDDAGSDEWEKTDSWPKETEEVLPSEVGAAAAPLDHSEEGKRRERSEKGVTIAPSSFSNAVFRWRDLEGRTQLGDLLATLSTEKVTSVWYAAIPSIVFEWAEGNLQEAITKQEIKGWSLNDHFTLFEKVLNAVAFLHSQKMIHGDIRPANIMRIGSQNPVSYRVGDYGSYGKDWSAIGEGKHGGLTQVGPAIGHLRETPFYAPERRSGTEFESANMAIIARIPPKATPVEKRTYNERVETGTVISEYQYLLLLGWRSELLAEDGRVNGSILNVIKNSKPADEKGPRPSYDERMGKGDRVRVRNYLFEVIDAGTTQDNLTYFVCTSRYAEVLHDHLIVNKEVDELADLTIIDLSNYIEFHQWSAATDLYGVGALSIYALFSCGLQNYPAPEEAVESPGGAQGQGTRGLEGAAKNPDRAFVEMINILASAPYFRFFWKELERFREEVETKFEQDPGAQHVSDMNLAKGDTVRGQTLYQLALYTTNNILQSTPKARVVLEHFGKNLAHFLLFMHFVLACLHRQSDMSPDDKNLSQPFAIDRAEAPQENGAASRALQRLQRIKGYLSQPFFTDFRCKMEHQLLNFNPRSDFQLRMELESLKSDMRKGMKELLDGTVWRLDWQKKLRDLSARVGE